MLPKGPDKKISGGLSLYIVPAKKTFLGEERQAVDLSAGYSFTPPPGFSLHKDLKELITNKEAKVLKELSSLNLDHAIDLKAKEIIGIYYSLAREKLFQEREFLLYRSSDTHFFIDILFKEDHIKIIIEPEEDEIRWFDKTDDFFIYNNYNAAFKVFMAL